MRVLQFFMAMAAFAIAGATLSAQVDVTSGPQTLQPGGGAFHWSVAIDFGSNAHTEDLNISVTTTGNGHVVTLVDHTAAARATTAAEWHDAHPLWDNASVGPGTHNLTIGGGPYTTPSLSGIHRFVFIVSNPAASLSDITISVDNGPANSASVSGSPTFPGSSVNPQSGSRTLVSGTSSEALIRHDAQQARGIVELMAAADELKFDFDVTFPTGGAALDVSLYGLIDAVATDIEFDIHLLVEDGGSSTSDTLSMPGGAQASEAVTTFQTAVHTGLQKFRVVVKNGAAFAGAQLVNFRVTWSHKINLGGVPTSGGPAKANEPPVSITPGATTFLTSPQTLTGDGGSQNPNSFTWSLEGAIPLGVSLEAANHPLDTGPTADLIFSSSTPANAAVTVRCLSPLSEWKEETYTLNFGATLQITEPTSSSLPDGIEDSQYIGITMVGANGQPPYSWDDGGTLPAGMSIDSGSGEISGTPDVGTVGNYSVTINLTDDNQDTFSKNYDLEIHAAGTMQITQNSLQNGRVGTSYGPVDVAVEPRAASYIWTATGLPDGLTIDNGTGRISGTPQPGSNGVHTVTITVADSAGFDDVTLSMNVELPPIDNSGSPGGSSGCAASQHSSTWFFLLVVLGGLAVLGRARREKAKA